MCPESRRATLWVGLILGWALLASTARARAEDDEPAEPLTVHGAFTLRYHPRWTSDDSDHDLDSTLSLDIGEASRHAVTGHVFLRGTADLDGNRDDGPFQSLADTYDHAVHGVLYEGYIDLNETEDFERVRFGRQLVFDTPEFVHFDGLSLETRPTADEKLRFGAYAGVSVHLYESSPDGDLVAGAFGSVEPWKGGRARVDWLYARDDTRLAVDRNHLFRAALWHDLSERWNLHGAYSWLEDQNRDLLLRATYLGSDLDLRVQGSYYRLLETQVDYALEFDPYYQQLQEFFPYQQVDMTIAKDFGNRFVVDAGFSVRVLDDSDDEGAFNREFERYFVTPTWVQDWATISLTGSLWYSDGQDIHTLGFDVTKDLTEQWEASVGSYYSLYKYDLFTDSERDDVRTYYFKLEHEVIEGLDCDLEASYEDDDFDDWFGVKAGLRWIF